MVHTSAKVDVGELVKWRTKAGTTTGEIFSIEQYKNPRDMFTLSIRVVPAGREALG